MEISDRVSNQTLFQKRNRNLPILSGTQSTVLLGNSGTLESNLELR